jgi:mutual gliding-motility protein MglA
MALVRHDSREIQFKIVYCGPGGGGKTTNLSYIHRRLDPHMRGNLVSIATEQNRTICFDFLPVHAVEIAGYRTRFQLYTAPGQEVLAETRRTVLAGADGIVFVADSSPGCFESNLVAYNGVRDSLRRNNVHPDRVPVVFQYNKRDHLNATRPEEFDEAFALRGPSFLACATTGYQVFATLDHLTGEILRGFHASLKGGRRSTIESENREQELVLEGAN